MSAQERSSHILTAFGLQREYMSIGVLPRSPLITERNLSPAGPDSEGEVRTGGADAYSAKIIAPKPTDPANPDYELFLNDWHEFNLEGMAEKQLARDKETVIQQ